MSGIKLTEQIAVVSMGCLLPDAHTPEQFWKNILEKKVSIESTTENRFDKAAHFRPDMHGKTDKFDKTYTDLGSTPVAFDFDGRRFRLPPTVCRHMDRNQQVMVLSTEQALSRVDHSNWNRDRVSVFVGSTFIGELHHHFQRRVHYHRFSYHLKNHPEFMAMDNAAQNAVLNDLEQRFLDGTFMISEDTAPGVLPNIIAARINSVFDFHGHAYMIDAACASTLAAIIAGVQHLESGESDVIICGGADLLNAELGRIYFSGINALSPNGSFPFDERADGFVIGEGGGVVILKRYSDAIRDNDNILALISGYGQNSDGKGKAIAAPNPKWQARAIQDAIEMANVDPHTIELIEAHGTSTKVGDKSEIDAMNLCFKSLGVTQNAFCAVGSAKSNVGHLKAAAGVPGFIKTVMALQNKTLPPTANCINISPALNLKDSPFYINTETQPWPDRSHPRRAGVSAFGFGGANYHITLEEFRPADVEDKLREIKLRKNKRAAAPAVAASTINAPAAVQTASDTETAAHQALALFVSGNDISQLQASLNGILTRLPSEAASRKDTLNLILTENFRAKHTDAHRLGIVFSDRVELKTKINAALQVLNQSSEKERDTRWPLLAPKGVFYRNTSPVSASEVAFLFPGQASQYPDMCLGLEQAYPFVAAFTAPMDQYWKDNCDEKISDLISSKSRGKDETVALLKNTRHTHPALLFGSVVCNEILKQHGVLPGYMVGHSAGEISALYAGGALDLENALKIMDYRSRSFIEMSANRPDGSVDFGKMVAVKTTRDNLDKLIADSGVAVAAANLNSPGQLIVSGFSKDIDTFVTYLDEQRIGYVILNVSHAFHSPVVAPAAEQFRAKLKNVSFNCPHTPVFANQTNQLYSDSPDDIRDTLYHQITGAVNFMGTIEKLAHRGVRLFVETGPNTVLSSLTRAILEDKNVSVIASNPKNKSDLEGIQHCIAALFAEGVNLTYIPPQVAPLSTVTLSNETATHVAAAPSLPGIVYSGVSVGLPGSYKNSFRDDNFEQLFEGRNFIEPLSDPDKSQLASLKVSKVKKTAQGPVFHLLDSLEDVIQLAGKIGRIDALKDYSIEADEVAHMNQAILQAVAAGFEALRDARIPLVRQYNKTASGGLLPDRWVIPKEMQRRTGVIFAHGFPMVETVIAEVTRHLNHRFAGAGRKDQIAFYQQLLPRIQDAKAKEILTDWFIENQTALKNITGDDDAFRFNHQFINQISSLANVRLAQYIQAQGPNFQLNAACSSTCTAITMAQEMISSGRVDRMLILGADDATSHLSLPYLGAGFLSTGAASCEANIYEAALPFDQRRNGMIMSAGAIAIVVERLDAVQARGVRPVCELLGSHVFNTAGHHARLNVPMYAEELKYFMDQMSASHALNIASLSRDLIYVSHETYTPARGGCSEAEAVSLNHVFGDRTPDILVTNTKGMTGHTMGASIEDVLAARALESGRIPPVVNFKVPDPKLAGLTLSSGGTHSRHYALRMAAGFGSQGNYILLRKYGAETFDASSQNPLDIYTDKRIEAPDKYAAWLDSMSGTTPATLEIEGRILRIADNRQGRPQTMKNTAEPTPSVIPANVSASTVPVSANQTAPSAYLTATASAAGKVDTAQIQRLVFATVAEISGYAPEMLEADMEVENDLGIDTVKQATILSALGDKLGVADEFEFQIAAYPTLASWIDLFAGLAKSGAREPLENTANTQTESPSGTTVTSVSIASRHDRRHIQQLVFSTVAEVSGYAPEMLEADMEVENDLGIDTVKQATILSLLGEKLGVADEFEFQIAAYPTLASWIDLFAGLADNGAHPPLDMPANRLIKSPSTTSAPSVSVGIGGDRVRIQQLVFATVAEVSGYAPEMLEADMEVENDLGIDTVKQATILSLLGEKLGVADEFEFQIAAYPTLASWIDLFTNLINQENTSAVAGSSESDAPPRNQTDAEANADRNDADTNTNAIDPLIHHLLIREKSSTGPDMNTTSAAAILKTRRIVVFGTQSSQTEQAVNRLTPFCADVIPVILGNDNSDSFAASVNAIQSGGLHETIWLDVSTTLTGGVEDTEPSRIQALLTTHFDLCRAIDSPQQHIQRIVSLGPQNAAHGTLIGFYQSLAKEWDIEYGAIIDATPFVPQSHGWPHLLTQLSGTLESAITEVTDDAIYAWRAAAEHELDDAASIIGQQPSGNTFGWTSDDVLVVVGATGITARIAIAFAQAHKSPIALLDINELSDENYLDERWREENHDARKREILEQLQSQGGRVRPVDVENVFLKALKQRELQHTISAIRDAGASAMFVQCDVTQKQSVQSAFDAVRAKFGRVNGILHGAGIEHSAMLNKKTKSDFFRIIDPKVLGACHLISCANETELKLWVCFSSISGVFGNAAQVDYSAANSFLNFFTLELQHRLPNTLVRSIAWSGWAETGMAWRNSYVREYAEKTGLHLIPPAAGASEAVALMSSFGGPAVQILHRGLGQMLDNRWRPKNGFPQPLIDRVEKTDDGYRFFKRLDIHVDEWLNQHRLINVPLLPAVGYLEMMAEIHCWKNPFGNGISFENLVVHDAFKLSKDAPRDITIDAMPIARGDVGISLKIFSEIKGRLFTDTRLYFSGEVTGATAEAPLWSDIWTEPAWTQTGTHSEVFEGIDKLPQNVVFGNLYHDFKREGAELAGMKYQWTNDAFMRDYGFPMEGLTNPKYRLADLRINFCLMDSLHQAGVVHTVLQTGKVHLPVGAQKFVVYKKCDMPGRLKNYARCIRRDADVFVYDIFLVTESNTVLATVYGAQFRKIS